MGKDILFDFNQWKKNFIFLSRSYLFSANTAIQLMPLMFLYLYSKWRLRLVINLKYTDSENILAFFDYDLYERYNEPEKLGYSHEEIELLKQGMKTRAIIASIEVNDECYEMVEDKNSKDRAVILGKISNPTISASFLCFFFLFLSHSKKKEKLF